MMRRRLRNFIFTLLSFSAAGCCQTPGFHWVDFKHEAGTVSPIAKILQAEEYTAVREIGIVGQSALVFTSARSSGNQSTPDSDSWAVYNVSLKEGRAQKLLSGFDLRIVTWLKFLPGDRGDLAVLYYDCFACEPNIMFTSFHYIPEHGWRARWESEATPDFPGISFVSMGAGIPYDEETVEQVWAVNAPPDGLATIGTWYYTHDLKTGKVKENIVTKFLVDGATDREIQLSGAAAIAWERNICRPTYPVPYLTGGQNSERCELLFANKKASKPH